jgi:hypothetical protein
LLPCWNWLGTRGVGSLHKAPPDRWPQERSGRGQRSIVVGGFCRHRVCGGCEGAAGLGRAKTFPWGRRKTVSGHILGCSCCDGEDTSRTENQTRLVAAGLPGCAVASVAVAPGPGSLPRRCGLLGVASPAVHALSLNL